MARTARTAQPRPFPATGWPTGADIARSLRRAGIPVVPAPVSDCRTRSTRTLWRVTDPSTGRCVTVNRTRLRHIAARLRAVAA
jgi:hypothetical protein